MKFSHLSATVFLASANALPFDNRLLSFGSLASDFIQSTFFAPAQHEQLGSQLVADTWAHFGEAVPDFKVPLSNPIAHERKPETEWDYIVQRQDILPNHQLRVKSTPKGLGVDEVKQYSGYLDIEDETKHLFFWFFESRNDPANDPVVLWLNGGPGCSSMTGLLFELGPASIGPDIKPVHNPYSWNNNASVIFLDQPVNVGFSYSEKRVSNTRAVGKDVYALLNLFFETFPEYNGNGFHISGESYAGHYIPGIATEILAHDAPERVFNLTSLLIGNGITDPLRQDPSYQKMACGEGGHPPIVSEEECANWNKDLPWIQQLTKACYKFDNALTCVPASIAAGRLLEPFEKTGLNIYDIRSPCEDSDSGLCYKGLDYIDQYLNLPEVQEALGVETKQFEGCSNSVGYNFALTGDGAKPFQQDVAAVLEKEIPVLIYAGDKDFICNWVGQELWLKKLEWSGLYLYNSKNKTVWETELGPAGETKSALGLTFLRVYEAGHMVPHDQPENSLEMFNTWLFGGSF